MKPFFLAAAKELSKSVTFAAIDHFHNRDGPSFDEDTRKERVGSKKHYIERMAQLQLLFQFARLMISNILAQANELETTNDDTPDEE